MQLATSAPGAISAIVPEFLATPDAAAFLGLSTGYLENLRVSGNGPRWHRLGAKAVRYRRADLLKWADARAHFSTSEAQTA
ncbi:hypothetical protein CSW58_09805 [Caulobacter sp. B11]|uniref:helix-turn-helix transcriptional regulator n=1 Tax=Caulobacter sp. B11 TaxID=2048899 RepID=UPI000C12DD4E|nr:helix-turn-helix domain-containing protein [Caulobacter sp. B11]PHY12853.1 hypothetical protein CSW58_09805 [Caulobacter sp. B11]